MSDKKQFTCRRADLRVRQGEYSKLWRAVCPHGWMSKGHKERETAARQWDTEAH